ncbi:Hypp1296 [Branchiostoma lanceolatum]|uniref:Hypp1296 protein n=1 Tax=Branchiostoma lanceolatum TaxID=7740 RepID=A0A8J9ZHF2_BRALA|nr:Hypp1296 [Branchiostoma lanceolatum]
MLSNRSTVPYLPPSPLGYPYLLICALAQPQADISIIAHVGHYEVHQNNTHICLVRTVTHLLVSDEESIY